MQVEIRQTLTVENTACSSVLPYINSLSNVVYISWNGSQHGTYTS